jgi:hypothetical protein
MERDGNKRAGHSLKPQPGLQTRDLKLDFKSTSVMTVNPVYDDRLTLNPGLRFRKETLTV